MKTELTLYNKIESQLQERRPTTVFPLTATHRKELRELRDRNVGNLRTKLSFIKSEKRDCYTKQYIADIEKEVGKKMSYVESVNASFVDMINKIKFLVETQKAVEERALESIGSCSTDNGYDEIEQLNVDAISNNYRRLRVDVSAQSKAIASSEFDKNYGTLFQEAGEKIDKLNEMYEEAINFGDLEQVKEIYYMFKNADSFLDNVSKLEIK
jgi:hypothetical protein